MDTSLIINARLVKTLCFTGPKCIRICLKSYRIQLDSYTHCKCLEKIL